MGGKQECYQRIVLFIFEESSAFLLLILLACESAEKMFEIRICFKSHRSVHILWGQRDYRYELIAKQTVDTRKLVY